MVAYIIKGETSGWFKGILMAGQHRGDWGFSQTKAEALRFLSEEEAMYFAETINEKCQVVEVVA